MTAMGIHITLQKTATPFWINWLSVFPTKINQTLEGGKRPKRQRDRGNTGFIPYDTIQMRKDRPHPATFPIKLPYMCIKLHSLKDGLVVMDPLLGIGLTAIASIRLGVSFTGFEIDNEYLDETSNRLNSSMDVF